ncbi:MAG TPA: PDZ domain-containing protein [Pyrinomonadaceae bacterium]|nr:PDZ domain-containing protein [Pyrinomonadaceae bacterium]
MLHRRALALWLALLLFLLGALTATAQEATAAGPQPEISFTVSMSKPHTHLLEVEMRLRSTRFPARLDLVMPVWAPGSYLIREFERHVQDFTAADSQGRGLNWQKVNKNTWRIETDGARDLLVTYKVYANELSVRTNDLNDRHAHWNNVALLMYPEGHLSAPSTLRVVPFGDWQVATGLPAVPGQANTFRAENFDVLFDSPVEVGIFKLLSFEASGVTHRLLIDGEGNYDLERIRRDVPKIVETLISMMGDVPYRDYLFIIHAYTRGDGALEHANSVSFIMERNSFRGAQYSLFFLPVMAHEFFHLWNVKRIRPDALGPFDYTRENYTRLLWVAEGITAYYGLLATRRAGLISEQEFLDKLSSEIETVQSQPGRFKMSVEEASFDAWIKYYRRDENSINSQISYYDKGQLLGLLLDMEIRRRSNGAKSLDDVMRFLYAEFYKKNRNYTPEDFQKAAERMAGGSLEQFFARYVRGREELDYSSALSTVGLQLGAGDPKAPVVERINFGADLIQEGERLMVSRVYEGTPAYDQGLNAGDQIVAVDGMRVNQQLFQMRLTEKRPGDTLNLTLFRDDDLRSFAIKLGGRVVRDYRIVPVKERTPEQVRQYKAWVDAR